MLVQRNPRVMMIAALFTLVLGAGCALRAAGPANVSVVASFYPLAEFARRIGGDRVSVRTLVPAGIEPHDYEPTPRDIVDLRQAGVVVYNGVGMEPRLDTLLRDLPSSVVRVEAAEGLPVLTGSPNAGGGPAASDRGAGPPDPHLWLDPLLALQEVDRIVAGLIRADPGGRLTYEANAARLSEDLRQLHEQILATLRPCRRRVIVTAHAAFQYFAQRYGLRQIAIAGLSPDAEPSPARLADIVRQVRRYGIQVIYAETLVSPQVAETIAREAGARVLILNPLEGLTPKEQRQGENYFTILRANLQNLAEGLECRK